MKKKNWKISVGVYFLIVLAFLFSAFYIIIPPLDAHTIFIIAAIIIFLALKRNDHIKPFEKIDILWMVLGAIGYLALIVYFTTTTIAAIPWWQIILIGIAADVIGSTIGSIPVAGDFLAAFLVIVMVIVVLHNPLVGFVVFALGIITLIPGPTLGANTLFLIAFKLFLTLFGL